MKRTFICLVILLIAVVPVDARTVEFTLHPAKAPEPAQKYQLLPKADEQIDADAVPLYEQAVKALPKGANVEQIREWVRLPAGQFPQKQAEETLGQYMESLRLVARAARCNECNWHQWKPGTQSANLSECRTLAFVIELWVTLEISRGGYEGAIAAMQTGFGMARHLGQAPIIVQAVIGAAVGGLMCRDVEQFVQQETAPNLYWALANLPKPIIDMEKSIESERKVHLEQVTNDVLRKQFEKQIEPMHEKVRMLAKRLDSNVNALQCVEAIRLFAAGHEGQLPNKLSDITEVEIPNDPVSGESFEYRRTDTGAVLQSAMPKSGDEKNVVRYEIVLKKGEAET